MEINENAQVDPTQIDDRRGGGGFGGLGGLGGGRIPIPTSKGGLIVTVVVILMALAGGGFARRQEQRAFLPTPGQRCDPAQRKDKPQALGAD